MNQKLKVLAIAMVLSSGVAHAAEEATVNTTTTTETQISTNPDYPVDTRIDTWVEGTILTLDADGKKLEVRGKKLPYATAYAEMEQEIADEVKDIADPAERQAKVDEIRKSWQEKLDKAAAETLESDSDYKANLPDEAGLTFHEVGTVRELAFLKGDKGLDLSGETKAVASAEVKAAGASLEVGADASTSTEELGAIKTLSQLRVGQRVLVGFDSGVLNNEVHSIVPLKATTAPAAPAAQ